MSTLRMNEEELDATLDWIASQQSLDDALHIIRGCFKGTERKFVEAANLLAHARPNSPLAKAIHAKPQRLDS